VSEPEPLLVAALPWLSQGDLFQEVSVVVAEPGFPVGLSAPVGPAMLMSHDCVLDKRNAAGSTLSSLNFMPLHQMSLAEPNHSAALRRGQLMPYNAMYVGDVPSIGPSYVEFSRIYRLPPKYLATELRTFDPPPEGEEVGEYLCAGRNDTRVAKLSAPALELLRSKWNAYWTRRQPPPKDGAPATQP